MPENNPIIYGLEFQVRSLAPLVAETETIKFLIGTQSTKMENNQVHLISLDDDNNLNSQIFQHSIGEIWSLTSSPHDSSLISTSYNSLTSEKNCVMGSALWRLPAPSDDTIQSLEKVQDFETHNYGSDVKNTTFHPVEKNKVAIVIDNKVLVRDVDQNRITSEILLESKGQPKFTTGKWNPQHSSSQFVGIHDCDVRAWDLRTPNKQVWQIEGAHSQFIRDFDLNPNKQYIIATAGDDGRTKFWDVRSPNMPLVCRSDHSHWVWSVRYNHYHDQLVATASSDTRVLITCLNSISSELTPSILKDEDDDVTKETMTDSVIATFEEHEESVYCVEWSSADPWTLASLSYDGRLLINKVPKNEKYKILALD